MRLGILGPVTAESGGRTLPVGSGRERFVLATLLLHAGRLVSTDRLVHAIWPVPPPTAKSQLHNMIRNLRRRLGPAGEDLIRTRPLGYELSLGEHEFDLAEFRRLADLGRQAVLQRDHPRAAELLREALRLWRGPALADVSDELAASLRPSLVEEQLDATELMLEALLRIGDLQEVVALTTKLTEDHPYREHLYELHMHALARSGRRAEALEVYRQAYRRLADDLGVEPGLGLRLLEQQVLAGLEPGSQEPDVHVPPSVPRQLPGAPRLFAGRDDALAALTAARETARTSTSLVAVTGAGGIGKTWLVLHWAHQHAAEFPDGQLHADLQGFTPAGVPLTPETVLRGFLEALGVADDQLPSDLTAQIGLYRSLVADQRLLVVLDNAHDAAQVVPLLPGGSECMAIVTSRNLLTGLMTAQSAEPVPLDALTARDSTALVERRLGRARAAAEAAAVEELVTYCAGSPLALSIVAGRAAMQPRAPLADWVSKLRENASRLDVLDWDEPSSSVSAVLAWSYRQLSAEAAEALSLVGLAPGSSLGVYAAANLLGRSVSETKAVLDGLVLVSMLQSRGPDRYGMHDLVRLFATRQASYGLPIERREDSLRRLVGYFIGSASAAQAFLDRYRPPIPLESVGSDVHVHPLADVEAAQAWLNEEFPCLLATHRLTAELGWHRATWELAWTLNVQLNHRGLVADALDVCTRGLEAARSLDDPAALILSVRRMGTAVRRSGRAQESLPYFAEAISLAQAAGDLEAEAYTQQELSRTQSDLGLEQEGLASGQLVLSLVRRIGNEAWEADALNSVAWSHAALGEFEAAFSAGSTALAMARRLGDLDSVAATLDTMGFIAQGRGDFHAAVSHLEEALRVLGQVSDTYYTVETLERLGSAHASLNDPTAAREAWQRALDLCTAQGRSADVDRLTRLLATL